MQDACLPACATTPTLYLLPASSCPVRPPLPTPGLLVRTHYLPLGPFDPTTLCIKDAPRERRVRAWWHAYVAPAMSPGSAPCLLSTAASARRAPCSAAVHACNVQPICTYLAWSCHRWSMSMHHLASYLDPQHHQPSVHLDPAGKGEPATSMHPANALCRVPSRTIMHWGGRGAAVDPSWTMASAMKVSRVCTSLYCPCY